MVVSHERSGTHFLMNALASCYGYVSQPWINFDLSGGNLLERHSREQLADRSTRSRADCPIANTSKSHHSAHFFTSPTASPDRTIRNLRALSRPGSGHALVLALPVSLPALGAGRPAGGGPIDLRPRDAVRTNPTSPGAASYQHKLERWAAQVDSWHQVAPAFPRIALVRYEDLISITRKP